MSNLNESHPPKQPEVAASPENSRREAAIAPLFYQPERLQLVIEAACHFHPEISPQFICPECGNSFCLDCAGLIGTSRACECRLCGALCRSYPEVRTQALALLDQNSNFGKNDLLFAVRYTRGVQLAPIICFTILLTFQFFGVTLLLAIAILFRYSSFIIKDVANGNSVGADSFDFSSLLTDFINPIVVGAGTVLITFGPLLLITKYLPFLNIFAPLALCWAIIYYPVALSIAGITNSFTAVINPLLGITTIKQLGKVYWQCFGYYLLLMGPIIWINIYILAYDEIISSSVILFALAAVSGVPLFCINMLVAALLGRVLFKCADCLGLAIKPK
jgi:hypothetical protein